MAIYFNNRFLQNDEAMLHISDLSIQRDYATFDFFRTVDGIPLFLQDHLDRFYASAKAMHLNIKQTREELAGIIIELIKQTGVQEAGIRLMLTGGYSPDSFEPAEPNLIIICNPIKMFDVADFEKGFSVITHEYQRDLPLIKSTNYLFAVWLQPELKKQQADEVLYFNNNIITEFPRGNVFIVSSGKFITPEKNVLLGVTRKNILKIAANILPVEERDITVKELMQANEVFLCSTTKRIVPVIKINNSPVGNGVPGEFTKLLYQNFLELEKTYVSQGSYVAV